MSTIEEIAAEFSVSLVEARQLAKVLRAWEHGYWAGEGRPNLDRARELWNEWQVNSRREDGARRERLWAPIVEYGKTVGLEEPDAIRWFKSEQTKFLRTGQRPSEDYIRLSVVRLGIVEDVETTWRRMKSHWRVRRRLGGDPKYVRRKTAGLLLSPKVKAQVIAEEGPQCQYCGVYTDSPEVDHIVQSLGSTLNGRRANLTVVCSPCNRSKGNQDVISWAQSQGSSIMARVEILLQTRQLIPYECIYCGEELADNTLGMCDGCWSDVMAKD
jgi:hypothetical protein